MLLYVKSRRGLSEEQVKSQNTLKRQFKYFKNTQQVKHFLIHVFLFLEMLRCHYTFLNKHGVVTRTFEDDYGEFESFFYTEDTREAIQEEALSYTIARDIVLKRGVNAFNNSVPIERYAGQYQFYPGYSPNMVTGIQEKLRNHEERLNLSATYLAKSISNMWKDDYPRLRNVMLEYSLKIVDNSLITREGEYEGHHQGREVLLFRKKVVFSKYQKIDVRSNFDEPAVLKPNTLYFLGERRRRDVSYDDYWTCVFMKDGRRCVSPGYNFSEELSRELSYHEDPDLLIRKAYGFSEDEEIPKEYRTPEQYGWLNYDRAFNYKGMPNYLKEQMCDLVASTCEEISEIAWCYKINIKGTDLEYKKIRRRVDELPNGEWWVAYFDHLYPAEVKWWQSRQPAGVLHRGVLDRNDQNNEFLQLVLLETPLAKVSPFLYFSIPTVINNINLVLGAENESFSNNKWIANFVDELDNLLSIQSKKQKEVIARYFRGKIRWNKSLSWRDSDKLSLYYACYTKVSYIKLRKRYDRLLETLCFILKKGMPDFPKWDAFLKEQKRKFEQVINDFFIEQWIKAQIYFYFRDNSIHFIKSYSVVEIEALYKESKKYVLKSFREFKFDSIWRFKFDSEYKAYTNSFKRLLHVHIKSIDSDKKKDWFRDELYNFLIGEGMVNRLLRDFGNVRSRPNNIWEDDNEYKWLERLVGALVELEGGPEKPSVYQKRRLYFFKENNEWFYGFLDDEGEWEQYPLDLIVKYSLLMSLPILVCDQFDSRLSKWKHDYFQNHAILHLYKEDEEPWMYRLVLRNKKPLIEEPLANRLSGESIEGFDLSQNMVFKSSDSIFYNLGSKNEFQLQLLSNIMSHYDLDYDDIFSLDDHKQGDVFPNPGWLAKESLEPYHCYQLASLIRDCHPGGLPFHLNSLLGVRYIFSNEPYYNLNRPGLSIGLLYFYKVLPNMLKNLAVWGNSALPEHWLDNQISNWREYISKRIKLLLPSLAVQAFSYFEGGFKPFFFGAEGENGFNDLIEKGIARYDEASSAWLSYIAPVLGLPVYPQSEDQVQASLAKAMLDGLFEALDDYLDFNRAHMHILKESAKEYLKGYLPINKKVVYQYFDANGQKIPFNQPFPYQDEYSVEKVEKMLSLFDDYNCKARYKGIILLQKRYKNRHDLGAVSSDPRSPLDVLEAMHEIQDNLKKMFSRLFRCLHTDTNKNAWCSMFSQNILPVQEKREEIQEWFAKKWDKIISWYSAFNWPLVQKWDSVDRIIARLVQYNREGDETRFSDYLKLLSGYGRKTENIKAVTDIPYCFGELMQKLEEVYLDTNPEVIKELELSVADQEDFYRQKEKSGKEDFFLPSLSRDRHYMFFSSRTPLKTAPESQKLLTYEM